MPTIQASIEEALSSIMSTTQEIRPLPPGLEQAMKDRIAHRTRVRIHTLEFSMTGDRVAVNGCVPSFYLRQLVFQAILDVLGPVGASEIKFNVHVAARPPNSVE
jgi:hypothetical protein